MINLISIGSDRNLFKEGSVARMRQIEYGALFNELHIVVFANRGFPKKIQIAPNVWVYGTQSLSKLSHVGRAVDVASQIVRDRQFSAKDTVVTVQDPFESGIVGMKLKKKFGVGLHVQIHTDFLSPFFAKESLLNKFRVFIAYRVLPYADAVRPVSQKIADDLVNPRSHIRLKGGVMPVVLPIFVDLKKFHDAPVSVDLKKLYPQFNFIILMASRLTKEKNFTFALNLFQKLVGKYQRIGLVIVGSGPEQKNLSKQVRVLGLEKKVVFEPWQQNLASYYKTAHLFLLTSQYEGYGMTLVEATACHCPTVSSDVGVARQLLKNETGSSLCPIGDMGCFFDHICRLVENPALRTLYVHEARRRLDAVVPLHKDAYLAQYQKNIESAVRLQAYFEN